MQQRQKSKKNDCLNCKYYESFVSFKSAINKTLNKVGNYGAEKELKTLLALNFQLYDTITQFMTECSID